MGPPLRQHRRAAGGGRPPVPRWGFDAVLLRGEPLRCGPLASHIVEHVLFKVDFPAEFHAQTAAEAAIALHPRVRARLDEIERIDIRTQEAAVRIIDKTGPLANPADRDHCLQYIVAVGLLAGELTDHHYDDEFAADPRIDRLRDLMRVAEERSYSTGYLDPSERSIANAVQVHFRDGTHTDRVEVVYPIGHPRRRAEALPRLRRKLAGQPGDGVRRRAGRAHRLLVRHRRGTGGHDRIGFHGHAGRGRGNERIPNMSDGFDWNAAYAGDGTDPVAADLPLLSLVPPRCRASAGSGLRYRRQYHRTRGGRLGRDRCGYRSTCHRNRPYRGAAARCRRPFRSRGSVSGETLPKSWTSRPGDHVRDTIWCSVHLPCHRGAAAGLQLSGWRSMRLRPAA